MRNREPLVSVVLPTFNQEDFVVESIESAVLQDYPNLEVVVGDDGSMDRTPALIRELERRHRGRIRAFVDWPHAGLTPNCNRILRECRGEYVAFDAGDDIYLPGKISAQVEWFEQRPERVLCGHDVEMFDSDTEAVMAFAHDQNPPISGRGAERWIDEGTIYWAVSVMVRSAAMPSFGFDERLPLASDWKFWIDVLAPGGEYGYLPQVLARYRRHRGGVTSSNLEQCSDDHLRTTRLVAEAYPHLTHIARKREAELNFDAARVLLEAGTKSGARRKFLEVFRAGTAGRRYWPAALRGLARSTLRFRSLLPAFLRHR